MSSYRTSRYNIYCICLYFINYVVIDHYLYYLIYSTRTSCRSARKQQRKMWNLKKGNFREEPTIVLTLKQIIEKFDKFKGYFIKFKYLILT